MLRFGNHNKSDRYPKIEVYEIVKYMIFPSIEILSISNDQFKKSKRFSIS